MTTRTLGFGSRLVSRRIAFTLQALAFAGGVTLCAAPFFTRVTTGYVANGGGDSMGIAWGDYDGDGDLDLVVANVNSQNESLYRNEGRGFVVVRSGDVVSSGGRSAGCAWADYDNDGFLDLVVVNHFDPILLFRGVGGRQLQRVTSGSVASAVAAGMTPAWADYDNDGWLDLFVANGGGSASQNNFLFRNNTDGTFTAVSTGSIVNDGGYSTASAWGDYDNDGDVDLFVANYWGPNFFYRNEGAGRFARVAEGPGASRGGDSNGAAWGDYDNDGDLDLFIANDVGVNNELYRNRGDGSFERITSGAIVNDGGFSFGAAWADFDNDGWLDLAVADRQGNGFLYRNKGDGTFEKVADDPVVQAGGNSNGCAWGDYDNDGFLDLAVANWNGQDEFLFRNLGNSNHWLKVRLVGTESNRLGLGAKVRVRAALGAGPVWQMREITGGDGWGMNALEAHFGLGSATEIERLRVEWPSGHVSELLKVAVDRTLVLEEPPPVLPRAAGVAVVPRGFERVEAAGWGGTFTSPVRIQTVYSAAHFPTGVVSITELRWRADGGRTQAAVSLPGVRIRLSTTARAPDQLGRDFAANLGADAATVFEGSITVPATPAPAAGTVQPFNLVVPLAEPFRYDPAQGDLLVDVRNPNAAAVAVDASNAVQDGASRAFALNADASEATYLDTGADILQIVYQRPEPPRFFASAPAGPVMEVAGMGMGLDWADYDGDGDLDLFVARQGGGNALYRNEGGVFERVTNSVVNLAGHSTGCCWGDYDGDGDADLFVVNRGQDHYFFVNRGDGTFTRNTQAAIVQAAPECYSAAWGDYDRDGFPDLLVVNAWQPNWLYHNNADGTFTRVDGGDLATDAAGWVSAQWVDFDGDGYVDLFLASGADDRSNRLYRNRGNGTFARVADGPVGADGGASVTGAWGDYDNDGDLDLFVANRWGTNFLYRNEGAAGFVRATAGTLTTDRGESNGAVWADFDNDGWLDLVVGNWEGHTNFLYRNHGDGRFERVVADPVVADAASTVGVGAVDFTGDGYLDLALTSYGSTNRLFVNRGGAHHWLAVKCAGTTSDRLGYGAKVRIQTSTAAGNRWQVRELSSGNGWTAGTPWAHFGLGTATRATRLRVEWPSGQVSELADVAADRVVTVAEPALARVELLPTAVQVRPGDRFRAQVVLSRAPAGLTGFTLELLYPVEAVRLQDASALRLGWDVPTTATAVWDVAPGSTNFAAQTGRVRLEVTSPTPWNLTGGMIAELDFTAEPAVVGATGLELVLGPVQLRTGDTVSAPLRTARLPLTGKPAEPVVLEVAARIGAQGFEVSLTGVPGATYVLEATGELNPPVVWSPVQSLVQGDGPLRFFEPNLTDVPRRFYRVRQGP